MRSCGCNDYLSIFNAVNDAIFIHDIETGNILDVNLKRIGGDEFALILPECDPDAAEAVCARIQKTVAAYNDSNRNLPLSISIGFSCGANANILDTFKEADNNMYREKLHRSKSARSAIVQTLMKALEARDYITEGHAERLQALVVKIGEKLGMSERNLSDLRLFAKFHDIGKVGVPDRILFKKGSLTKEEMLVMRRHCEIGHRIAQSAPDLVLISDWILKHHEWWNGDGYPLGLESKFHLNAVSWRLRTLSTL